MKKVILIFVFTIAAFHITYVSSLRCYACGVSVGENEENPDLTCVNSPMNVSSNPYIVCKPTKKYCVIYRNDYVSTGKIQSMLRTCGESAVDSDVEGGGVIARARSCQTDLCNSGDGISYAGGSGNGNGKMTSILVPDEADD